MALFVYSFRGWWLHLVGCLPENGDDCMPWITFLCFERGIVFPFLLPCCFAIFYTRTLNDIPALFFPCLYHMKLPFHPFFFFFFFFFRFSSPSKAQCWPVTGRGLCLWKR